MRCPSTTRPAIPASGTSSGDDTHGLLTRLEVPMGTAAAVQATPVFLDRKATTEKGLRSRERSRGSRC